MSLNCDNAMRSFDGIQSSKLVVETLSKSNFSRALAQCDISDAFDSNANGDDLLSAKPAHDDVGVRISSLFLK